MCRNITTLRGLEPPASADEVRDAARQFVRKVGGITTPTQLDRDDVRRCVEGIARLIEELLASLPPRRTAPAGPPSRRRPAAAPPRSEGG